MIYCHAKRDSGMSVEHLKKTFLKGLRNIGERERVLLIPPDITRVHGLAGLLTVWAVEYYEEKVKAILPAIGTHFPMTEEEINAMFPGVDHALFKVHDWRNDVMEIGEVPASFIEEVSEGKLSYPWKAQVNKMLVTGGFDLILSLGQVVPHEVIGMANYSKNIFIGTGGSDGLNKSHYLGAVYGMERIMGRVDNPVRAVIDYAHENFAQKIPLVFALTVVFSNDKGEAKPAGLFMGDDRECFEQASELSLKKNFLMVDKPFKRVVVYLDPAEYRSTWLGNKAIYRTRMAIADGGELIILAPGVSSFGEDEEIDRLIRTHGYSGRDTTLKAVGREDELKSNLSAAAHLIHGSSEGRFSIRYCPGHLSEEEITSVGYLYGDLAEYTEKFITEGIEDGERLDREGEPFYYISNPALGLWAHEERFNA